MAVGWAGCRLVNFLVFSCLFHLAELAIHTWLLYHLYQRGQVVWFAACTGVTLLSLIAAQVLSFQLRADRPKDVQTRRWLFVLAHVLFAGQVWRYGRLALSSRLAITRREVWELFVVRLMGVFTCTFPGICVVTYMLFKDALDKKTETQWALLACVVGYSMSVIWMLVTYRKLCHICCVVGALPPSGGGLVWKVPWRVAEVLARVLSIVLFSLAHTYWIVLVLLLRWLTMSLLLVLDTTSGQTKAKSPPGKTAFELLVSSYIHIFVHFNISRGKSRLVLILYYVFTSAECVTLTVLWLMYDTRTGHHLALGTTVGVALVSSVLCTVGYYGCLHRRFRRQDSESEDAVCYFQCISCRFEQLGRPGEPYSNAHITVQTNPNPPNVCEPLPLTSDQLSPAPTHRSSGVPTPASRARTKPPKHIRRTVNMCRVEYENGMPHKAARAQQQEGELSWDDYDINTMSDSTVTDFTTSDSYDQCMRDTFRELGIDDPEASTSYAVRGHNVPVCKPSDYGYCSGISSSSSKINNPGPSRLAATIRSQSLHASRSVPLFPNNCNGVWSDDGSSTVTSLSSHVPALVRNKWGTRLPTAGVTSTSRFSDTTSLDSSVSHLTSTTLTSVCGYSGPMLRAMPVRRHTTHGQRRPDRRRPRPRQRKRLQRPYPSDRGTTDTASSVVTESELGS